MTVFQFSHQKTRSRLYFAAGLLVLYAGHVAVFAADRTDLMRETFDFQSFINNPPIIQKLVYAIEMPPVGDGGTNRQPTMFYLVRWESPQKFVLRVNSSLDELMKTSEEVTSAEWFSAGDAQWWHLVKRPTNDFLVRVWHTTTPSDKRRNPVLTTVNTVRHINLDHVIKLGLSYLPPCGVVWQGDHFVFTNDVEQTAGTGHVLRDEVGRVSSVMFTFTRPILINGKWEIRAWRHRNDYTYEEADTIPTGFPSQIDNYVLRNDAAPFHNERIRFYQVVFAKEPLAAAELDYGSVVGRHTPTLWTTINDTEYVFDGKRWKPIPIPESELFIARRAPQWAVILVVAVLLAPTVLLAVWAKRNKNAVQE